MSNDSRHEKLTAHIRALEDHKMLLNNLHFDDDAILVNAKNSLENLGITLEEYLKVVGLP